MALSTFTHEGLTFDVDDRGQGEAVVLLHGCPQTRTAWSAITPRLVEAGYRVLAPDQRGYGRSSKPEAIEDYDIAHLTGDLVGMLDELGIDKAVFIGHDWGSLVVWQSALLHPERVAGVCGMSVPFVPRAGGPPIQIMRAVFQGQFFYIVYFQEPGVADAELGKDAAKTMRRLLAGVKVDPSTPIDASYAANDGRGFVDRMPEPEKLPDWLSQEELDFYAAEFGRTGFTGGINWYRNFDRNWELTEHLAGAKVTMPSLFITGSADPVNLMSPTAVMDGWLDDHRGTHLIEGAGHWVQQEAADEVNGLLISFLDGLDLTKD